LALVDQADDAASQSGAIVRLDACRAERCVPPAVGDQLFRRGRIRWARGRAAGAASESAAGRRRIAGQRAPAAEHDHHRHGALRVARRHERHLEFDGDRRVRRVVHVPDELPAEDRVTADRRFDRSLDLPRDVRDVLRHAAEHLPLEHLHDLRPALVPPHGRGCDLAAVLERQDVRKIRVGVCQRFVVVRVVGVLFVAAGPWPQGLDAQLVHHVLSVGRRCFLGSGARLGGRRGRRGIGWGASLRQEEDRGSDKE
jgi:hypothetical protein